MGPVGVGRGSLGVRQQRVEGPRSDGVARGLELGRQRTGERWWRPGLRRGIWGRQGAIACSCRLVS